MIYRKQIIVIIAFVGIISGCNAQTVQQSLEEDKTKTSKVRRVDGETNNEKNEFLHNEDIVFHIGISSNPLTVKDDKIYSGGWNYRVTVENITEIEKEKFKKIPFEMWLQLLEDENTDWAANLILYDIYERDAALLARRDDKNRWREYMKYEDIDYWKEILSKKH